MKNNRYIIYEKDVEARKVPPVVVIDGVPYKIEKFTPSISHGLLGPGESKSVIKWLVRLKYYISTRGDMVTYYLLNTNKEIIHHSTVYAKCFEFSFLKDNDICIGGPCYTSPRYRGKGIYPQMLKFITGNYKGKNCRAFLIINTKNNASIRGAIKAGFSRYGYAGRNIFQCFFEERRDIGDDCSEKE